MKKLWIDIETYSSIDLRKANVYRYVEDPAFEIMMAAWSTDGKNVEVALGYEEIWDIPGLWDPKVLKVAHNAGFERVCFSKFVGVKTGEYLPPEDWHDTMAVAGELGFPQSLEKLAPALGAAPKDSAGTRLINLFCKPDSKGKRTMPEDEPMKWLDFIAYCEQDVQTLIEVDHALEAYGGWPTETERQVFLADQIINDRGIKIDVRLARKAARVGELNQAEQKQRVRELAGVDNPNSIPQMNRWVEEQGLAELLPNMQAKTVELALQDHSLSDVQREVLGLRQELALAAPAKFSAALQSEVSGRLRGSLKFFGAHTGRWAGRGTQLQNLPRAAFDNEVDQYLAIEELLAGEQVSSEELKRLVRPLFLGPFTVVDYSSIEARVVAWLAGENWVLEACRAGRDIYVETADRMGGLTRSQGKIAVLALGYNGGANSLKVMASENDVYEMGGEEVRIIDMSDDDLRNHFVYPWRNANSNIAKLWKTLDYRFRAGGPVGDILEVEKVGRNDRLLRLPSGRSIAYRRCAVRKDEKGRDRLSFHSPQGFRTDTYGGKLTENATQAVARDLLAEALVRLESEGYRVVAHIHDEIVIEGEHDVDVIAEIMCELPDWAEGLPVDGEGFTTERYRKG